VEEDERHWEKAALQPESNLIFTFSPNGSGNLPISDVQAVELEAG
jgi:hypothetical protein